MSAPDGRSPFVMLTANGWVSVVPEADLVAARAELEVLRANGLNAIRLSVDEARDPLYALGIAKHDLAALRQTATRLARALDALVGEMPNVIFTDQPTYLSGRSRDEMRAAREANAVLSDPLVAELLEEVRDAHEA